MGLPRVLILTNWRPDGRYAGAEALRRVLQYFPLARIRWASLQELIDGSRPGLPDIRSFPPVRLHWRLDSTLAHNVWTYGLQARRLARRIAAWASDPAPELLWVLPELGAINVGFHLAEMLDVPVHATLYDAPESAREACLSPFYYSAYMRSVQRFFARFSSVDAVSRGLLDHVRESGLLNDRCRDLVFPPSVPRSWMTDRDADRQMPELPGNGNVRRIGFCGAFRVTDEQWQIFLDRLGEMPFEFEIIAFAEEASVPRCRPPSGVRLFVRPYVENEEELIRSFRQEGIHAGYVGLWRSPGRSLFARTSLSSKMTTYAAAGVPIIVDGPPDSAVWNLVSSYGAGVQLGSDGVRAGELEGLFSSDGVWCRMAAGSARLCRERMVLEVNVRDFAHVLSAGERPGERT